MTFEIELSLNILWLSHSGAIHNILVLSLTERPLNKVRGCVAFCFLWSIYHITIWSPQIPYSLHTVYFRGVFHIGICLFCVLFFLNHCQSVQRMLCLQLLMNQKFEPWSKALHENKMNLSCDIKPTNNNNKIKKNEMKTLSRAQLYTNFIGENWTFSNLTPWPIIYFFTIAFIIMWRTPNNKISVKSLIYVTANWHKLLLSLLLGCNFLCFKRNWYFNFLPRNKNKTKSMNLNSFWPVLSKL